MELDSWDILREGLENQAPRDSSTPGAKLIMASKDRRILGY